VVYPTIEPYASGKLDVGDGNEVYWEACGNPDGQPAVVLHGGPGSGCASWFRTLFNPAHYRIVLFDQRNCGRSTPNASDPATNLACNTTWHLVADIERLRQHLDLERWLVVGGSWGSTLALTYAESHLERVSALVLFGVTTGRRSEFDWTFRGGIGAFFPEEWDRLCAAMPPSDGDRDVVDTYYRHLHSADQSLREKAAYEWCLWESATPAWPPTPGLAPRFEDPAFRLSFARIVTHYARANGFLEDGQLMDGATALSGIPGILVNGRFDFQAPIGNAWALKKVWPRAEMVVVPEAGHSAGGAIAQEVVRATDRLLSAH
jgi:proline iminopeptidase